MRVFLSWSTPRSKLVAEAIGDWLPGVIQSAEPWISTAIAKGAKGNLELDAILEKSSVGIICLTADNLKSEWIHFEAGALSKRRDAHVCTFLLDIGGESLARPLSDFQYTIFEKDDVRKLVSDINAMSEKAGDKRIDDRILGRTFDSQWPVLENSLKSIPAASRADSQAAEKTDRQLLTEVLSEVRELRSRQMDLTRLHETLTPPTQRTLRKSKDRPTHRSHDEAGEGLLSPELIKRVSRITGVSNADVLLLLPIFDTLSPERTQEIPEQELRHLAAAHFYTARGKTHFNALFSHESAVITPDLNITDQGLMVLRFIAGIITGTEEM
jgi:hypothetical protein